MSIENSITKLAEAISSIAQSGLALAASIDRYCAIAQDQAVGISGDTDMKNIIDSAVAEFEAEHEAHKVEAEAKKAEAEAPKPEPKAETPKPEPEVMGDALITFEQAKTVVIDTVKTAGKDAVAEIFARLGAKKLPDLNPEQYGELVELCEEACANGIPF